MSLVPTLRMTSYKTALWICMLALVLWGLIPLLINSRAHAATLSSRKVTISTSKAAAAGVTYSFAFTTGTTSTIQSMIFQFCDTPLGTCTLPGTDATPLSGERMDVDAAATAAPGTFTGVSGNPFAEQTSVLGACTDGAAGTGTSTMYCVKRTDATSETAGAKTFSITNIRNPILTMGTSNTFESIYVRITTFSDNAFATSVDTGTVAAAATQQLTVNGRVQERLEFCVAAIGDGGASDTTLPADCSAAPAATTIDIGVIDNSSIVKAPVDNSATNGANDSLGMAMVNTNASGGVVIAYYPEAASSVSGGDTDQLRNFRVLPTDCSATTSSTTDQCFVAASTTGSTFSAGSEMFGLNIPCIDTSQSTGTPTANLTASSSYSNTDATTTSSADCENTDSGVKFAWDNSGTAATLASSSTVVNDEIVKLSFGATASATTPTGSYTVTTTYIATPTF